jgi:hypothetical protein
MRVLFILERAVRSEQIPNWGEDPFQVVRTANGRTGSRRHRYVYRRGHEESRKRRKRQCREQSSDVSIITANEGTEDFTDGCRKDGLLTAKVTGAMDH